MGISMNFLNNLERKIGKHAIPGLMKYMVGCYVIGYILQYMFPQAIAYLTLEPYMIIHNLQIWRIISWVLIAPGGGSFIIFAIIMIIFYYQIGTALERTWGTFRFNVFIFGGIILTIIASFILYFVSGQGYLMLYGGYFTTYYLNLSIFLAFAVTYPNEQVLVYFLIPVRMKWLAIVYIILAVVGAVSGGVVSIVAIVASLVNLLLFFLQTGMLKQISPKEMKRRADFKRKVNGQGGWPGGDPFRGQGQSGRSPFGGQNQNGRGTYGAGGRASGRTAGRGGATAAGSAWGARNTSGGSGRISKHKCAICGMTELDDPSLEFRFCSKCNGNYEYCQNHLFTHKHVQ